ncbi:glycosyltransferase [Thauera aromatica]|uniref:glycosyltransferase n=1 Tax=Thauera aromatica TaxID=59405 RepID=UPI001FFD653F|nr:glycosyltransferase [Thauera aromatica]MCK2097403.1 glycosyltransferase [Thauera aromatica]
MTRLLFDVTRLLQSGLHTGIQRVVRRLLGASARQLAGEGGEVWPVVFEGEQWRRLPHLAPHALEGCGVQPQPAGWPIMPGAGDALLLFDASWYADPWPAVSAALARGARLYGMVHDLLPLDRPDWFRTELQPRFGDHLHQLCRQATRVFVPSQISAARLTTWCAAHRAAPRIALLPHGGDFCAAGAQAGAAPLPVELKALLGSCSAAAPLFLVLGTLEPRKGHARILDAFDALWAAGGRQRLLFVGKVGWSVDGLLRRIDAHPLRERQLFHRAAVDDPTLLHCFRHARALIHLAQDEGFGLPVLEAAMQQCPVIAADIPVLREAGMGWPEYVPLHDEAALRTAILRASRARSAQPPCRTWDSVARQLGEVLARDALPSPANIA